MVVGSAFGTVSNKNFAFADEVTAAQVVEAKADNARSEALPVDLVNSAPETARQINTDSTTVAATTVQPLEITPAKPADSMLNFISSTGAKNITTSTEKLPKADVAIARALSLVGNASLACEDGKCYRLCDYLAGYIWGYQSSGYESAATHWETAINTGIAHKDDRNPPLGAALFFKGNSPDGHIAIYVGNGMVVSNWATSANGYNVYLMPADAYGDYLGWAPPVFHGGDVGSAL